MSHTHTNTRCSRCTLASAVAIFSCFLLVAPSARADSITYQLLPNPQADMTNNGNTADLSGTITISNSAGSPLGTFSSSNDSTLSVSSDLTMTSTGPDTVPTVTQSGSASLSSILQAGNVQFTSAGLFLFPTTTFEISNFPGSLESGVEGDWNPANSGEYLGSADADSLQWFHDFVPNFQRGLVLRQRPVANRRSGARTEDALTLLGLALVGVVAVGLRRRRLVDRFANERHSSPQRFTQGMAFSRSHAGDWGFDASLASASGWCYQRSNCEDNRCSLAPAVPARACSRTPRPTPSRRSQSLRELPESA